MRDSAFNTSLYHKLFLTCLRDTLMPGSAVVSIAMPGDVFNEDLQQGSKRLDVYEALSADFLAAYPGYATSLLASRPGQRILAAEAGHVQVAEPRRVGRGFIPMEPQQVKAGSLSRFLQGLRDPGLLYLGCDCDGGELFASVFETVVERGTLVWMELRARHCAATLERLRSHPLWDQVEAFALDRQLGCLDLRQDEAPTGQEIYGLLLLPRAHWNSHGLRRLAARPVGGQPEALRAPLAVPAGRQTSDGLLDILSGTGSEPYVPIAPEKIFLPAGSHVFGRKVKLHTFQHGHGEQGLDTAGQRQVELMFQPPMPGVFEVRLVMGWEPEHEVQMTVDALRVSMRWIDDWYQLQSGLHLTIEHAARPLIFELSYSGGNKPMGLMIKGIELEYVTQPATGTLSSVSLA